MITNSEHAIQTYSFTIRNAVKRLRLHLRKLEEGDVVAEEDLNGEEELKEEVGSEGSMSRTWSRRPGG